MRNASTEALSTSSGAATEELLALLVGSLVRLLRAGGLSHDEIMKTVETALRAHRTECSSLQPMNLGQAQRDCMEVLCLWRRDPDFMTADGQPAPLAIGGGPASFDEICARARVTTGSAELLDTLRAFGAIRLVDNGRVTPETPTFLLSTGPGASQIAFDGVLKQIAGFVRGIEHNVLGSDSSRKSRFERACSVVVAEELVPVFERTVASRGQDFIDILDEWLERHSKVVSSRDRYVEVGVGAYFLDLGIVEKTK